MAQHTKSAIKPDHRFSCNRRRIADRALNSQDSARSPKHRPSRPALNLSVALTLRGVTREGHHNPVAQTRRRVAMADALRTANGFAPRGGCGGPARDRANPDRRIPDWVFTPLADRPAANYLPPALLKHRPPKLGGPARRGILRWNAGPNTRAPKHNRALCASTAYAVALEAQTRSSASHNVGYATAQDGPAELFANAPLRLCPQGRRAGQQRHAPPAVGTDAVAARCHANHHRVELHQELANHVGTPLRPAPRKRGAALLLLLRPRRRAEEGLQKAV